MRNQPILLVAAQRISAMSLLIALVAMFFASCATSQPAPSAGSPSPSSALSKNNGQGFRNHHDIPPQIAIDVGSFSIEVENPITDVPSSGTGTATTGTYKDPGGKSVHMALIKVIRTDDGAILYQNFNATDAAIVFTIDPSTSGHKVNIKGEPSTPKTIKFESSRTLIVETINSSRPGRQQKLKDDSLRINNVKVLKGSDTLFSYDTPASTDPLCKYRVAIWVEKED